MSSAVLTDIEGTTTAVSFVLDVLFPYARAHLAEFVRREAASAEVRAQLRAVAVEAGRTLDDEEAIATLLRWIDEDRKVTPLKALQGMVWEAGYRTGELTGHVYEDAARRLREWHALGRKLYVYSSGSVQAQRLLFAHSIAGDLTPLFSGYFDTATGPKRDTQSYRKIVGQIGQVPSEVLFLSDLGEELDAAREAGLRTAWLVRGATPDPAARHPQHADFDAIRP